MAARRALRLSPRDPFSAIYYGIAAYAQFVGRNYDEAMRLAREGIRQRSDFVGAHRVLDRRRRHGRTGRGRHGRARRSCAARSPISRSPGSRAKCRSSRTPTGSTIWKASAAPAWIRKPAHYRPKLFPPAAVTSGDRTPSPACGGGLERGPAAAPQTPPLWRRTGVTNGRSKLGREYQPQSLLSGRCPLPDPPPQAGEGVQSFSGSTQQ